MEQTPKLSRTSRKHPLYIHQTFSKSPHPSLSNPKNLNTQNYDQNCLLYVCMDMCMYVCKLVCRWRRWTEVVQAKQHPQSFKRVQWWMAHAYRYCKSYLLWTGNFDAWRTYKSLGSSSFNLAWKLHLNSWYHYHYCFSRSWFFECMCWWNHSFLRGKVKILQRWFRLVCKNESWVR